MLGRRRARLIALDRLDVYRAYRAGAVTLSQIVLDGLGYGVRLVDAHPAVETYVHLDRYIGAYAARTQPVRRSHARVVAYDAQYAVVLLARQRPFEQVAQRAARQIDGYLEYEQRYRRCGYRVGYAPTLAQKECQRYAEGRAGRRERVAAVVPRVGLLGGRVGAACGAYRVAVEYLLDRDRQHGCRECHGMRARQGAALGYQHYVAYAVVEDHPSDGQQGERYYDRRQRLVLAVSVVVVVVFGFRREPCEGQHDDIGKHIRERVHAVGHHGAAAAEDAGEDLGCG